MCGDRRRHYDDEFIDELMRAVVGKIREGAGKVFLAGNLWHLLRFWRVRAMSFHFSGTFVISQCCFSVPRARNSLTNSLPLQSRFAGQLVLQAWTRDALPRFVATGPNTGMVAIILAPIPNYSSLYKNQDKPHLCPIQHVTKIMALFCGFNDLMLSPLKKSGSNPHMGATRLVPISEIHEYPRTGATEFVPHHRIPHTGKIWGPTGYPIDVVHNESLPTHGGEIRLGQDRQPYPAHPYWA